MRHFPFILAVLCCGGCAARPDAARHQPAATESRIARSGLTAYDYYGAEGFGRRIEFDGSALQVVVTSNHGQPDKRVWGRELTTAERAFLSERVEQTSRQALEPAYRDPHIWDGLQIHFELRPVGRPAQGVSIANRFVEELAALTDALNVLLPPEYRVRYREWKEEMERSDEQAAADEAAG